MSVCTNTRAAAAQAASVPAAETLGCSGVRHPVPGLGLIKDAERNHHIQKGFTCLILHLDAPCADGDVCVVRAKKTTRSRGTTRGVKLLNYLKS